MGKRGAGSGLASSYQVDLFSGLSLCPSERIERRRRKRRKGGWRSQTLLFLSFSSNERGKARERSKRVSFISASSDSHSLLPSLPSFCLCQAVAYRASFPLSRSPFLHFYLPPKRDKKSPRRPLSSFLPPRDFFSRR